MNKKNNFSRIPNPYNPYDIKAGRSYYNKGVTSEIKRLFEAQPPQKIVFIQGTEGSGKSSTFDRIQTDPEIMGTYYIPIYVNVNKIISVKNDTILHYLYEHIKKSIEKSGIQLFDDPTKSAVGNVTLKDFYFLFSRLERKLKHNKPLVMLIVDDFDRLFELQDIRDQVKEAILFFKEVTQKKEYIRIILSGRSELGENLKLTGLEIDLNNIFMLKMKNLDTAEFNSAIIEPVKEWISYTPEALDEIRRLTGWNLYCQQLLCYYIVFHLNGEKKSRCGINDVRYAAELTINDAREDFNYFWEKLPVHDKLVCSAIMDENEVKKRGLYYFIEPSSLLNKVFEPEVLNGLLSRLHGYDFIIKVNGRRFDDFPFRIPLYGNWIKKEHPFIKTVIENFSTIANEKEFIELGKIIHELPLDFFPPDRKPIAQFIREWFELKNVLKEAGKISHKEIELPLQIFCKILDLPIKEEHSSHVEFFPIDFRRLNIGSIEEAFFLIQDRNDPEKEDIRHLRDLIMSHVNSTRPCVFFCLRKNEMIEELARKTFLNIIMIENNDLKTILFSSRPLQVFKEILLRRISSSQISPYQTDGPAIATFYGRGSELRKILGSTQRSFAVVGARKIGKSSLLARIKKELEDIGSYSIFIDIESPVNPDHKSFLHRMEVELGRLFNVSYHFEDDIDKFCHTVKTLPTQKRKLILIFDEMDELLEYDREKGFQLIRSFRSLFHEGYCQFIFSGFEVLQNVRRGIDSPFYNFCEEIQLGPLEIKFALDLITEPMANIGIGYENPEDRELIMQYTAQHPNLIQFFCKHLIEKLDEHSDSNRDGHRRRMISKEDIRDLYNFKYDNYVIEDFYMFYTDLDDLEKLTVVLLVEVYPTEEFFSIRTVNSKLMGYGIQLNESRIHKTIQKLVLRFILLDKGKGRYVFALSHFPEMLRDRIEPELRESLVQRILKKEA